MKKSLSEHAGGFEALRSRNRVRQGQEMQHSTVADDVCAVGSHQMSDDIGARAGGAQEHGGYGLSLDSIDMGGGLIKFTIP